MTFGLALLRKQFSTQRSDAKRRGVPFVLTFDEWLAIWEASGRLQERGNGHGRYVMARYGDRGGYEVGNVRIILFEENCREYRSTLDAKTRTGIGHRGKVVSVTTRKKLSAKAKLRKFSPETRMKMSASRRRTMLSATRDETGRFA